MGEPLWRRPLTTAEEKAAKSAWPDYYGGKPHPFSTSTGMEGRCHHCGYARSLLHIPPWEPPIVSNSAPVKTDLPAPVFVDHSFEARQARIRALNAPAVSNPSGGEPENTKESTMKLNLTVSVNGVESILPILAALNSVDGVEVEAITEPKPEPKAYSTGRIVATGEGDMRRLLERAIQEKSEVVLDYTDVNGKCSIGRRVVPVAFEDDLLVARDVPHKLSTTRSFRLDRMSRVELR